MSEQSVSAYNDDPDTIDEAEQAVADTLQVAPTASIVAILEKATLDQMMVTARQYPRSVTSAIKAINTIAIVDEESAQECLYTLPRGKKPIIGPSIRFAELVKQCWGNCASESEPTHEDLEKGWVHARGIFIDYQTGAITRKTTRRRILDRHGRIYNEDMRIMTANAACAIAERNAILAGVPRPIWRRAYNDVLQFAAGKIEVFAESRDRVLRSFAEFGATAEMVFGALEVRGVDDLTLEHIPVLRGMYSALKNGEATPEEMFDPRRGRPFTPVRNPLANDPQPGEQVDDDAAAAASDAPFDDARPIEAARDQAAAAPASAKAADKPAPAAAEPKQEAKPPAKAAPAKAAPKAAEIATGEQYMAHARAWIAASKSTAGIMDRWKAERSLRDRLRSADEPLTEDQGNTLVAERDARIAKLDEDR